MLNLPFIPCPYFLILTCQEDLFIFKTTSYLTLPAVHRLLVELLTNDKIDLRGADCGGGVDVEVVAVLLYHDVGLGSSRHCYLSQHGVHT